MGVIFSPLLEGSTFLPAECMKDPWSSTWRSSIALIPLLKMPEPLCIWNCSRSAVDFNRSGLGELGPFSGGVNPLSRKNWLYFIFNRGFRLCFVLPTGK